MSKWTHVLSTIEVETSVFAKGNMDAIKELLKDAPKITGSERDADVFVNIPSGYNMMISGDCNSCEHRLTITHTGENEFSCGADKDSPCPSIKLQTRVIITIAGYLRDRTKKETEKEMKSFISYLRKDCGFYIECTNIKIID